MTIPNPDHVRWTDELAAKLPEPPMIAKALAIAYDRFCQHHDRARFNAEKLAIRSCKL